MESILWLGAENLDIGVHELGFMIVLVIMFGNAVLMLEELVRHLI